MLDYGRRLLLLGALTMVGTPAQALSPEATAARDASNDFAIDLYGRLASRRPGNLFFAPQIISTALALPYAGARGDTAAEIARALHLTLPQDRVPAAYAALLGILMSSGGDRAYHLSIATRLWAQRGTAFLDPFLVTARNAYGADVDLVDFGRDPDQVRREINAWVQQATANKIREMDPGTLDPTTRLVLANAIYFQGDWAKQFDMRATRDAPFQLSASLSVVAPLMSGKIPAGYSEHPEASLKVVTLPYQGGDLSMVVLLPDAPDGLAALEAKLTTEILHVWTSTLQRNEVVVYLPRFSVESNLGLTEPLADMGMASAFSSRADFSGMNGQRDLFLSAVVHKARVDVDEKGTEAAAATGMSIRLMSVEHKQLIFRADHPFVFLIRHEPTGTILFLGRVIDPTSLT